MNTPDRRDELKTVALICLALNDCLCTANLLDIDPVCFENVRNTYRTAIMNLCVCTRINNVCMFINNVCMFINKITLLNKLVRSVRKRVAEAGLERATSRL